MSKSFVEILLKNPSKPTTISGLDGRLLKSVSSELNESGKSAEMQLRSAGFKIRLVTPTSFGTQIEFAKSYDKEEIEDALSSYNFKLKGKSVFVID